MRTFLFCSRSMMRSARIGGVAHQFFLAFGRRRHVGRQQEILAGDFKAVAGIEEERGVAGLDRLVEREQRLG